MAVLRERIETKLGMHEAFAYVADFANSEQWDPGVASSLRLDEGAVRVGARYRLGIRMGGRVTSMEYEITRLEAPHRVVLEGRGSGVRAVDDITFNATLSGTRIDYIADIRLQGPLGLLAPFAGGAFRRIAENARNGMQRTLDDLAGRRVGTPEPAPPAPASSAAPAARP